MAVFQFKAAHLIFLGGFFWLLLLLEDELVNFKGKERNRSEMCGLQTLNFSLAFSKILNLNLWQPKFVFFNNKITHIKFKKSGEWYEYVH